MALVNGTVGKDFIHRAGDGLVPPDATYTDNPGTTVFGDLVFGLQEADIIYGDAGDDTLDGGPNGDALNGGTGIDAASYGDSPDGLTASLASPSVNTGDAAGDTYTSIENLIGSPFDDTLIGDAGDNVLQGGDGADVLNGRQRFDYASYSLAPAAVTASLADPSGNTGFADGDTYIAIEGLIGTNFDDALTGDAGDNVLEGLFGADALDGGDGFNSAKYTTGVIANLDDPTLNTGEAFGDTYTSIEGLIGSDFADILTGDASDNLLDGGFGPDSLTGNGGADTFVFSPGYSFDAVADFSAGDNDKIDLSKFAAIQSFSQVQALATQVGGDTVLSFGAGDQLTLVGITATDLTADDFNLAASPSLVFAPPILASDTFGAGAAAGGWVSQDQTPRVLGDVNGDGRADIVGFGFDGAFTAFGQTDGTFAAPITASDTFGSSAAAGGWVSQDQTPRVLGDVNGDGRADIVGFGFTGAFTAFGQADGTFAAPITASDTFGSSAAAGGWFSQNENPRVVGDVNGDGNADIVGFGFAGTFTALGNADGTFGAPFVASNTFGSGAVAGGWSNQDEAPRLLGDVNGDGRADIVGFGFSGAFTALGQADGTFGPATLASDSFGSSAAAGGWVSQDQTPRVLGDVNGDGRADILGFGFGGTYTALGQADGTFETPVFSIANFGSSAAAGGWTTEDAYPRLAADVTGDHLADIVGFGFAGAYVSQASLA